MPSLLQEMKPAIHEEVAKEINAFAAKSKPQPFIFLVIAVPSLMTISTEGFGEGVGDVERTTV